MRENARWRYSPAIMTVSRYWTAELAAKSCENAQLPVQGTPTLVLTSSSIKLYKDIRCMVEFFPNLQDVTLRGKFCSDRQLVISPDGRSLQPDDISCNLERLDVFHLQSPSHFYSQLPRVLRCLKNLKSLKAWAFEVLTVLTVPDDHSRLSRLQCLELLTDWPADNFVLQSVANHCPSLEKLIIFSTRPYPETQSEEPVNVLNLLDKCPNLERLFISGTKMYEQTHFLRRARELGVTSIPRDWLSKILVERVYCLDALDSDNPARTFNLKEFSIFRTIVPLDGVDHISQNSPGFRELVIGEPATRQSWCETFC
jgi:hypothetical protein